MQRQDIVDVLTRNNYYYDFEKYSDEQLYDILQKVQNTISEDEIQQIAQPS
jgi:hypothetical protein